MSSSAPARDDAPDPEWENYFTRDPERPESLEELLRRVPAFDQLNTEEVATLARQVHLRTFSRGQAVVRRGARRSGFYVIRSGSVHMVRENPTGGEVTAPLGPAAIIGRFALLDDSPAPATFIAAERTELVGFFRPDLMDIAATDPGLGCRILLRLGEEMSAALNRDYAHLKALGWTVEGTGGELAPRL